MMDEWFDDPQAAANHMVLGMNLDQRRKARGKSGGKQTPTWILREPPYTGGGRLDLFLR